MSGASTFAENEQLSPWPPYHADRGYDPRDSCVTVSTVGSCGGFAVQHLAGRSAQELAGDLVRGPGAGRRIFALLWSGTANPAAHWSKHIFVLDPQAARALKDLGFTRKGLAGYIYDRTSVPFEELGPDERRGLDERIEGSARGTMIPADCIPPDRLPVFRDALGPGGRVPVLMSPEDLPFAVAGAGGGVPGNAVWFSYIKAVYAWTAHQTRPARGATLTRAGRQPQGLQGREDRSCRR